MQHQQWFLLHYVKAWDSFTVLYHLEHHSFQRHLETTWKTNIQGLFHSFISNTKIAIAVGQGRKNQDSGMGGESGSLKGSLALATLLNWTSLHYKNQGMVSFPWTNNSQKGKISLDPLPTIQLQVVAIQQQGKWCRPKFFFQHYGKVPWGWE
jgi:hypothetical protein